MLSTWLIQVIDELNIRMKSLYFFLLLLFALSMACNSGAGDWQEQVFPLDLDSRYELVDSIRSVAGCRGPNGFFKTEIRAKKDGYVYFKQTYT